MSIGDYKIRNQSGTPWCGKPWCGKPWCGKPWCVSSRTTPSYEVSSRTIKSEGPSPPHRNSHLDKGIIYFWTATINGWKHLLEKDAFKDIIIDSMGYLSGAGLVDVFAFIIMPNHLHLIWRVNAPNGKESPHGSLLKYTAHVFQQKLRQEDPRRLAPYRVEAANKRYEFWQRDSLAIPLFTRKVAMQKLNYLHNNPLAEHWGLVKDPCDYKYSSARYYERNEKDYPFLKDLWEAIG